MGVRRRASARWRKSVGQIADTAINLVIGDWMMTLDLRSKVRAANREQGGPLCRTSRKSLL
jgi:hypothetical protein